MARLKIASIFLTALVVAGCGPKETIRVNPPPPPASYMVCEQLPVSPDLEPLEAITLPDGRVVYLKSDVDARDGSIARYIVAVRGSWFSCANQLAAVRDYYEAVE